MNPLVKALEDILKEVKLGAVHTSGQRIKAIATEALSQSKEGEGPEQDLKTLWQDIDLIIDYADFNEIQKYKMIKDKVHSFNKSIKP